MMDEDEQLEGAASNNRIQVSNLDGQPAHAQNDNYGEEDDMMVDNEMTIGTKYVLIDTSRGEQL